MECACFILVFTSFSCSSPRLSLPSLTARALSLTARSLSPLSLFQRSLSLSLAQVRSAKTYWHVMSTETSLLHGTQRIYPEVRNLGPYLKPLFNALVKPLLKPSTLIEPLLQPTSEPSSHRFPPAHTTYAPPPVRRYTLPRWWA